MKPRRKREMHGVVPRIKIWCSEFSFFPLQAYMTRKNAWFIQGFDRSKHIFERTFFNRFASSMIKLLVSETKWSSLLARTCALILYISIWIFDFGPVKSYRDFRETGPMSENECAKWHVLVWNRVMIWRARCRHTAYLVFQAYSTSKPFTLYINFSSVLKYVNMRKEILYLQLAM